ncbi:hypothetical protein BH10ACI2_BH10ACI2_09860 [soil metagenome]
MKSKLNITTGGIMKNIKYLLLTVAFVMTITFAGSALNSNGTMSVSAQDSMMTKIAKGTKNTTVKVVKKGLRVGHTVGSKTWDGTKWVGSKSWKGGKWVAVKTVHGTKWVYRKAKYPFVKHTRKP